MYKSVFQNSKAALAFAGLTVFSAVSLVGTSDDSGIVGTAADMIGAQRANIASEAQAFAEGQSQGDKPGKADAGLGGKGSVFGEYGADGKAGAKVSGAAANAGGNPMTAPLSPTAVVDHRGPTTISEPFISDREMTIEPK
jgi:hypothetical protein